jgi:hypothetical protein
VTQWPGGRWSGLRLLVGHVTPWSTRPSPKRLHGRFRTDVPVCDVMSEGPQALHLVLRARNKRPRLGGPRGRLRLRRAPSAAYHRLGRRFPVSRQGERGLRSASVGGRCSRPLPGRRSAEGASCPRSLVRACDPGSAPPPWVVERSDVDAGLPDPGQLIGPMHRHHGGHGGVDASGALRRRDPAGRRPRLGRRRGRGRGPARGAGRPVPAATPSPAGPTCLGRCPCDRGHRADRRLRGRSGGLGSGLAGCVACQPGPLPHAPGPRRSGQNFQTPNFSPSSLVRTIWPCREWTSNTTQPCEVSPLLSVA